MTSVNPILTTTCFLAAGSRQQTFVQTRFKQWLILTLFGPNPRNGSTGGAPVPEKRSRTTLQLTGPNECSDVTWDMGEKMDRQRTPKLAQMQCLLSLPLSHTARAMAMKRECVSPVRTAAKTKAQKHKDTRTPPGTYADLRESLAAGAVAAALPFPDLKTWQKEVVKNSTRGYYRDRKDKWFASLHQRVAKCAERPASYDFVASKTKSKEAQACQDFLAFWTCNPKEAADACDSFLATKVKKEEMLVPKAEPAETLEEAHHVSDWQVAVDMERTWSEKCHEEPILASMEGPTGSCVWPEAHRPSTKAEVVQELQKAHDVQKDSEDKLRKKKDAVSKSIWASEDAEDPEQPTASASSGLPNTVKPVSGEPAEAAPAELSTQAEAAPKPKLSEEAEAGTAKADPKPPTTTEAAPQPMLSERPESTSTAGEAEKGPELGAGHGAAEAIPPTMLVEETVPADLFTQAETGPQPKPSEQPESTSTAGKAEVAPELAPAHGEPVPTTQAETAPQPKPSEQPDSTSNCGHDVDPPAPAPPTPQSCASLRSALSHEIQTLQDQEMSINDAESQGHHAADAAEQGHSTGTIFFSRLSLSRSLSFNVSQFNC